MKTKGLKMLFMVLFTVTLGMGTALCGAAGQPLRVNAESYPDLKFTLINSGTEYKVAAGNRSIITAEIPKTFNGLPVTQIADNGFTACKSLSKVKIPETIQKIGNNAFFNDTSLKRVVGMPEVKHFGTNSFSTCTSLDYLIFPSDIEFLGNNVIKDIPNTVYSRASEETMNALNENWKYNGNVVYGNNIVYNPYTDPEGLEGYEITSFQNLDKSSNPLVIYSWCYYDENDEKGKPLLNIAGNALFGYEAPSITLKHPDGSRLTHAINVQPNAFAYTTTDSINIEPDITLNAYDESFESGGDFLFNCSTASSITLPDSLTAISNGMFADCSNLTELKTTNKNVETNHLSNKITRIENDAFSGCVSLPELYVTDKIAFIGENAFSGWGDGTIKQDIYIDTAGSDSDWDTLWSGGVNANKCIIEFLKATAYSINFNVQQDGVVGPTQIGSKTVTPHSVLSDIPGYADPTSVTHDFTCWYTTAMRVEGTEFGTDEKIRQNLTLYAGWAIKSFDIKFLQNNYLHFYDIQSNLIDSETKKFQYGETYQFYTVLNKGYSNPVISCGGTSLKPNSGGIYTLTATKSATINVQADFILYSVEYKGLRGGTNPSTNPITFTIGSGDITLSAPEWDAYQTGEWDKKVININSISEGKTSVTVTAVWADAKRFYITYDLDGDPNATNPTDNPTSYTVNDSVSFKQPSSPGYKNGMWMTEKWVPDQRWEDICIKVKWGIPNEYEVTLDHNNGSGETTVLSVKYGTLLPFSIKPKLRDYEFLGYFKGNSKYYNYDMTVTQKWYIADDDTLTARWEQVIFTITLQQLNGTGTGGETELRLRYGQDWPQITMPVRRGYVFGGYQYSGDKYYNKDGTPLLAYFFFKHNITLSGSWTALPYYFIVDRIHYMSSTGEIIKRFVGEYEGAYECTADETMTWVDQQTGERDTRNFTGWIVNLNGPQAYDKDTNPWVELDDKRTTTLKVPELLDKLPAFEENDNIYVRAVYGAQTGGGGSCLAEGTLITLSDGTQKPVEQLTGNETLLVWNLSEGHFDTAPIIFVDKDPLSSYEVIRLSFSDGTTVKVITEHAFWDTTLNRYVYLRKDAGKYIGHWFSKQSSDENGRLIKSEAQLANVELEQEDTTAWSPVTYGHFCYYVNGMLSMPGGIEGMINIFAVDPDSMKYDETAMLSDIEEYGLFTYEEFKETLPVSEEIFEAFSGQYLKVAIAKGMITFDRLRELVSRYEKFF